jgi:hypothetical protein
MTAYPYILFNQTPEQLRRIGARGGRAHGRNHRARRALLPLAARPVPVTEETAAEAIVRLDEQFPWLRGAEKRSAQRARVVPAPPARTPEPRAPSIGNAGGATVPVVTASPTPLEATRRPRQAAA